MLLQSAIRALPRDRRGNVAMVFALASVPVFGLAGGAVDLHQAGRDKAALQAAYDAAALAGARQGSLGDAAARLTAQNYLNAHLKDRLAQYPYDITTSNGGRTVRVTSNGAKMRTDFLALMGLRELDITVRATATATSIVTVTSKKPVTAQLDPEAGDYNRMYVYCYNNSRRNQSDGGRSQMTAIADNAGTTYNFNMPVCKENETISYRLYNVRNARTKPWLWDNNVPGTLVKNNTADIADPWSNNFSYNYYSDTENESGKLKPRFDNNMPILETFICDNLAQCRPQSQGGIIPSGTDRKPNEANKRCEPGKFMYFGWEDRPPGYGWTDADYDDIRVIVECPSTNTSNTEVVRLVE